MDKRVFSVVLLSILIGVFRVFAQDQAQAPAYNEADFWLFNVTEKDATVQSTRRLDGEYEVWYSSGKFLIRPTGSAEAETKQNLSELRRMVSSNDERQYLQFPLVVGKKWSVDYEAQPRGAARPVGRHADMTVTGREKVATPAGKFRAFKIERYDTGSGVRKRGAGNWVYTYYYSPETRSMVKFHFEDQPRAGGGVTGHKTDIELIKFGSKLPK